jgi:RNA-directed DNA polymerase
MRTLVQRVRKMETLARAWHVILENGRSSQSLSTRREIEEFARTAESRLEKIQRQLNLGRFIFKPATGIPIPKQGKDAIRPLVVAPIPSRIVQRAILEVLLQLPQICHLAENEFSFGGVRKRQGGKLGAVPAATQAVLESVESGLTYVVRSDISAFFTKISKPAVTAIVEKAADDADFVELFSSAIAVELENLASLRQYAAQFPIHEIGVAQGNSLSPLLGNILLRGFDQEMNNGDCRCLRYIDDFLILGRSRAAADAAFSRAVTLLSRHGLEVNDKTQRSDIAQGFVFLGVEFQNGAVRPSRESRRRLVGNISEVFNDSVSAFRSYKKGGAMPPRRSLLRTLTEVSGMVQGWGSHYSFCNERNVVGQMDRALDQMLRGYLGRYAAERKELDAEGCRRLLGVPLLEELASRSSSWNKAEMNET